ncbi:hypothetical protein KIPB_010650, partial [Kipferlia bialata]
KNGVEVLIMSSRHNTGERLMRLGGIAAILRYPTMLTPGDDSEDSDSF